MEGLERTSEGAARRGLAASVCPRGEQLCGGQPGARSPAARCGAGEARRTDVVAVLALLAQPSLSAVPVPPVPQAAREAAFLPSPSASY